jgi:2'-5' RNA ligase
MILKEKTGLSDRNSTRTFMTIAIPVEISRQISSVLKVFYKEARNLVFVPNDQMHITLQFLGNDISKGTLDRIGETIQPYIKQINSPLVKTGDLRFGHKSQLIPTVLFLEIDQTPEIQEITRVIHNVIKELDFGEVRREKDYKKLIYHITLARAKHHVGRSFGRTIQGIIAKTNIPSLEFYPKTINLTNSKYSIKGSKYTEYSSFPLINEKPVE